MTTENRESTVELVDAVHGFMQLGGQTTGKMNAEQACLYTGLQLEELAEKIEAISKGCLTRDAAAPLEAFVQLMNLHALNFKRGLHQGDILRANHADLIDADFDLAWVSIGALVSTSPEPERAIAHGTFTNLDKFRDGKCVKDANGKIQKPADWRAPDFSPYIDTRVLV
jgi:predicted HAD superfamily Cof-like phosphohydrolase